MNFDEILDFLFHRIIGICITIASTVILLLALSSCLGNDCLACFWQGCGCTDCSKTCQDCSEEENDVCYSCFGGEDSCMLNDCLFGGGCVAECGDCYVQCGGLNYSCFEALCFGDGLGKGCYESDGYSRYSCVNCKAYCDATDDPGSPIYKRVYLYSITAIDNGTSRTVDIYENTGSIGYTYSSSGYVFAGYFSQPNGQGVRYTDQYGYIVSMPTSGATIYAHYKDKFEGVEFSVNIYTPMESDYMQYEFMSAFTVVKGEDLTGTLPLIEGKNGLKFYGWTREPQGAAIYGDENGLLDSYLIFDPINFGFDYYYDYSSEQRVIKLYMRYIPETYDVKILYDEELTFDYTSYVNLSYGKPLYELTPKEFSDYVFVGFAEDAEGFYIYDEDTIIEASMEVYAIYSKKVTVNFEIDGQPTFNESFPTGVLVNLPEPSQDVPGYKFDGWTEGGNYAHAFTSKVFSESDNGITLKAKYELTSYNIAFKNPDGNIIRNENYQYGVEKILMDASQDFYDFVGWRNETTNAVYSDGKLPITLYGDITLIAVYTPKKYTVTLDAGSVSMGSNSTKLVTYGETFSLPVPQRSGYEFGGWFYATASGKEVLVTDSYGNSFDVFEKYGGVTYTGGSDNINIIFFAKWNLDKFTVNFISDGSVFNTVDVDYNSKLPNLPQDPTKAGHKFVGWYMDSQLLDPDNLPTITSNKTITAKFEPRQYTITLIITRPGAEFDSGVTEMTVNYKFGDKHITFENVTCAGYALTGWYENENDRTSRCIDASGETLQRLLDFLSTEKAEYKLYARFEASANH